MENGTTTQIYGASILPKEITATEKVRPKLLFEVMAKTYYGLRTMAKNKKKFGQVESIVMHT